MVRLTPPQIAALRFIAGGQRGINDVPGPMLDVIRRLSLRGWAEWEESTDDQFRARITTDGWHILKLVCGPYNAAAGSCLPPEGCL